MWWRLFLFGFLAEGHFPRAPHQSILSDNKGDNEMTSAALHRSTDIYLKVEQTPENLGWHEGFATSHRFKLGPLPQNDVGRIAQQLEC